MSYEEHRVRVRNFRSLSTKDPLLVEIPGTGGKPRKLHHRAAAALAEMSAAIKRDLGIDVLIASGHRRRRWKSKADYDAAMIKQYGSVAEGRKWKAYESPHETGLAIDFGVGGLEPKRATKDAQRETPLHAWLVEHAHEYGFRPYKREPWHWEFLISRDDYERLPESIGA